MNNKEIGEFLAAKRRQLRIDVEEMAKRVGCNRTTIVRMENGSSSLRRSKVTDVAQAYEVEPKELARLCGYKAGSIPANFDLQITATIEDLEFLITVSRGLQQPMNIGTIRDLLLCRKNKCTDVTSSAT